MALGGAENVAVLNWEVSREASLRRRHLSHDLVEVRGLIKLIPAI